MKSALRLYRTATGPVVEHEGRFHPISGQSWDPLLCEDDLAGRLRAVVARGPGGEAPGEVLAPIEGQEVWAAGVTYWRSRDARREESAASGGATFYDRVYDADRPELFLKATAHRVVGPGGCLRLRRDSKWIVPEPELTLVVNARGAIVGYTVGNDLSCRDIEGENPLYLPQAKTYDGCAALGPCILVTDEPLPGATEIALRIFREGRALVSGAARVDQLRRTPEQLVEWLFRECSFPAGCFLLTGTGVVPPDDFSLQAGDKIEIVIEPIGVLVNSVA